MESFAANLARKITTSLGYSQEKEQVIAYGLTAMFQFISILLIVTIIGLLGNFPYECILVFFGVGMLRKSTGGAHSSTMFGCMIISCLNIVILAFLSTYVLIFPVSVSYCIIFYTITYLICIYFIYRYAPLDSPNKRITSAAKRSRLRKQSFYGILIYFIASLAFLLLSTYDNQFLSLANSLCLLTVWQCVTITPAGVKILHLIDRCLVSSKQ